MTDRKSPTSPRTVRRRQHDASELAEALRDADPQTLSVIIARLAEADASILSLQSEEDACSCPGTIERGKPASVRRG